MCKQMSLYGRLRKCTNHHFGAYEHNDYCQILCINPVVNKGAQSKQIHLNTSSKSPFLSDTILLTFLVKGINIYKQQSFKIESVKIAFILR